MLGAEVERHHHGDDNHHIVGADTATQCQNGEDSAHNQGDDSLYLHEVCQVFQ